ncbi:MAG TPA: hypothetical protein VGF48_23275 [Thermoanaerobaculia bacterium]
MPTPDLSQYYGNLQTGQNERIQAKIVAYTNIGNGTFSVLNPSEISFSGTYSIVGHSGNVDLTLTVTGTNSGTFQFNGASGPCTFTEQDGYLYVYFNEGGGQTNVQVQFWSNGLWIGGPATPYNLWIGP